MRIVMVMDPPEQLDPRGDSSLALLRCAQGRGHEIAWCSGIDISLADGRVGAMARPVEVTEGPGGAIRCVSDQARYIDLSRVDLVVVRTDPPFDLAYVRLTWLLDGLRGLTLVVNDPQGLRGANEKLWSYRFPDLIPPTLITADGEALLRFAEQHAGAVLKPIEGHAGRGVHALLPGDPNARTIVDSLTARGQRHVLAQRFLHEVWSGDRRILLLDGEPLGAIDRVPSGGDFRANLGVGGRARAAELDADDLRVVARIGPALRDEGLSFVGIDVIGGWLSEVNVTSPTGLRQLASLTGTEPELLILKAWERAARACG